MRIIQTVKGLIGEGENPHLKIAKELVVESARPLIFDCIRTKEESDAMMGDLTKCLMYLDYVERKIAINEEPQIFYDWCHRDA